MIVLWRKSSLAIYSFFLLWCFKFSVMTIYSFYNRKVIKLYYFSNVEQKCNLVKLNSLLTSWILFVAVVNIKSDQNCRNRFWGMGCPWIGTFSWKNLHSPVEIQSEGKLTAWSPSPPVMMASERATRSCQVCSQGERCARRALPSGWCSRSGRITGVCSSGLHFVLSCLFSVHVCLVPAKSNRDIEWTPRQVQCCPRGGGKCKGACVYSVSWYLCALDSVP